ncbi:MAG: transcriptional regulator [Candidatus Hydrogenedentes bacterium]|nr:transcriptional regulator [Candidatus Hydrogenedentota bacterium]
MRTKHSTAKRTTPQQNAAPAAPEPVDASTFDRVIHERLRLAIVSALAVNDGMSFNELRRILRTTDGNLSVHARKLEDAGYITCTKSFDGRIPRTEFKITEVGRKTLEKYLAHMEALIRRVREG